MGVIGKPYRYWHSPDAGWKVDVQGGAVAGNVLRRFFAQTLTIDQVPESVALVGHQPLDRYWIVVVKPPGRREFVGGFFSDSEYAQLCWDPFVVARDPTLSDCAATFEQVLGVPLRGRAMTADGGGRLGVGDGRAYLRIAYEVFLGAGDMGRRAPYMSVLPRGFKAADFPLCCFSADRAEPFSLEEVETSLPVVSERGLDRLEHAKTLSDEVHHEPSASAREVGGSSMEQSVLAQPPAKTAADEVRAPLSWEADTTRRRKPEPEGATGNPASETTASGAPPARDMGDRVPVAALELELARLLERLERMEAHVTVLANQPSNQQRRGLDRSVIGIVLSVVAVAVVFGWMLFSRPPQPDLSGYVTAESLDAKMKAAAESLQTSLNGKAAAKDLAQLTTDLGAVRTDLEALKKSLAPVRGAAHSRGTAPTQRNPRPKDKKDQGDPSGRVHSASQPK
jgi:hypothetical protein